MLRAACSLRGGAIHTSRGGSFRSLLTVSAATAPLGGGDGEATPATGAALARKPIILLDVDGVINMIFNSFVPVEKREWW